MDSQPSITIEEDNQTKNKEENRPERVSKPNTTIEEIINAQNPERPSNLKRTKVHRNIQLVSNVEEYDVAEDFNKTKCNITFGQLFNAAPKVRAQVTQGLRLEKDSSRITGTIDNVLASAVLVNNIDHSYVSKSKEAQEEDIAMVNASVDGVPGKLLIDSCSNLNIITKRYLDKLPTQYDPIGISRGTIRLATKDDDYSEGIIVRVPVTIENITFEVDFRVMDKEEPFYDMLINLKTQVDNKHFIHPIRYSLCQVKPNGFVDTIAPINNQALEEEQLLCMIKKVPEEEDTKTKLKEIEGLPPKEYIHHPNFKATLNEKYQGTIIALLEDFIVVIATFTEELTPSKLKPHRIKLKPNAKPFKQRYYRLSKFKSDILKRELAKLIHKRLIEPSLALFCLIYILFYFLSTTIFLIQYLNHRMSTY